MNSSDLLELANRERPDLIEKTAQAVVILEALAPELVPGMMNDFQSITSVAHEKVAAIPDAAKNLLAAAGGAMLVGLGSSVATDLYDAARRGLTKGRNFKRIMEHSPELRESEDRERVVKNFDMLHRYAPDFTADPILGGTLLKTLVDSVGGSEHNLIQSLISARKSLQDTKSNQFRPTTFNNMFESKGGKKDGDTPIHYHQHFHGTKPKNKPIALKNPGATKTNES